MRSPESVGSALPASPIAVCIPFVMGEVRSMLWRNASFGKPSGQLVWCAAARSKIDYGLPHVGIL